MNTSSQGLCCFTQYKKLQMKLIISTYQLIWVDIQLYINTEQGRITKTLCDFSCDKLTGLMMVD